MPAVDALAQEFSGRAKVVMVDVDRFIFNDKSVLEQFKVKALPLLAVYKDGAEIARVPGLDEHGKRRMAEILSTALEGTEATG